MSSSDRTAKLKSLAGYTDAVNEETVEIDEDEFRQLDDSPRTEGSASQQASPSHRIIERWCKVTPAPEAPCFYTIALKPDDKDVEFITSYHQDNPYLAESVHQRYETYKTLKASSLQILAAHFAATDLK